MKSLLCLFGLYVLGNVGADDKQSSNFIPLNTFWNVNQNFSRTIKYLRTDRFVNVYVGSAIGKEDLLKRIIFTPNVGDPVSAYDLSINYYEATSGQKQPFAVNISVTITSDLTKDEASTLHSYTYITDYDSSYMAVYDCLYNEQLDPAYMVNVFLNNYDEKATNGQNYYSTFYNAKEDQKPMIQAFILGDTWDDMQEVLFAYHEYFNRLVFPVPGYLIATYFQNAPFVPPLFSISPVANPVTEGDLLPAGAGCFMSGNYPNTANAVSEPVSVRFAQNVNATVNITFALLPHSSFTFSAGVSPNFYNYTVENTNDITTEFTTKSLDIVLDRFTLTFSSVHAAAWTLKYHAVNFYDPEIPTPLPLWSTTQKSALTTSLNFTGTDIPTPHPFSPSAPNQISTTPLTIETTTSASRVRDCFSLVCALIALTSLISNRL